MDKIHMPSFPVHPTATMTICVINVLLSYLVIRYVKDLFHQPECRNVDPQRRNFIYYLYFTVLIANIIFFFTGFYFLKVPRSIEVNIQSTVLVVIQSLIVIGVAHYVIHYLDEIFAHPECRQVDKTSREVIYGWNWLGIVISVISLVAVVIHSL